MATWQDVKDAATANDEAWVKVDQKLADMQAVIDNMPASPSSDDYQAVVNQLRAHVQEAQAVVQEAPALPVEEVPTDVPVE